MSFPNPSGKSVAIIGSRSFEDKAMLYEFLTPRIEKIKLIISGGARGADTLATMWAAEYGVPYLVFPALWHDPKTGKLDKGAGFKRNWHIIDSCDMVLAFYDGVSRGTAHSLEAAKTLGKPVQIINFTPQPIEKKRQPRGILKVVIDSESKEEII
jgi:hypothetical protein